MKAVGILGSARYNGNTAQFLDAALAGAQEGGAQIKRYDLYTLKYTGCVSCFACKRIGGASHGRCAVSDDLKPVLDDVLTADLLFIASPVYFGDVTGEVRSFLERLLFPGLLYRRHGAVSYDRHLKVGLLYTMNVEDPIECGYSSLFEQNQRICEAYLGKTQTIWAADTCQFDDYSKYDSSVFDSEHKQLMRKEKFPEDLRTAHNFGFNLARSI